MEHPKPKKSRTRVIIPWFYNKFFMYACGILLTLTIIFLLYQVFFFVQPIFSFITTLIPPIIFSILFYYLLRPIVHFFEKFHIPRTLSIIFIYLVTALFLVIFVAYVVPLLVEQVAALANASAIALEKMKNTSGLISIGPFVIDWQKEIGQYIFGFLNEITVAISKNVLDIIGTVTRVATILVIIPFILFYLLKEDENFSSRFFDSLPEHFDKDFKKIVQNMDATLSNYITSLVMVALSVGAMLFFTYLIIGLKYALILSLFAVIFTSIPFLGPFLAITPAVLVGLSESPFMTLKVIIGFVIVQQIESNIISPQIIGQRLNIHPLTIILLLLAAGTLYGLLGLIFATPIYALLKVLFTNLYKIYHLRYHKIKANLGTPSIKEQELK